MVMLYSHFPLLPVEKLEKIWPIPAFSFPLEHCSHCNIPMTTNELHRCPCVAHQGYLEETELRSSFSKSTGCSIEAKTRTPLTVSRTGPLIHS